MSNFNNKSIENSSEAWNVAQGYTHLKILKPLVETDKLVKIAIYGTENIEDSFNIHPQIKVNMRIEAINRLVDLLKEIIENSRFAMNKKGTKDKIDLLKDDILEVEKYLDKISETKTDQRTQETILNINEEHFNLCLKCLRDIKQELTTPLNQNSLIFPTSDEIDLDKVKQEFIYGG